MRIIAGRFGGRKLPAAVPPGARPTSDRVREALFSMLEARQAVAGAHVLDLYAGTGALGLEALSRGAASLTAVDKEPRALAAIRRNAAALDPSAPVHCVRGDVGNLSWTKLKTKNPSIAPFGLVLMDPPYADLATATKWLQRLTDELSHLENLPVSVFHINCVIL